MIRHSIVLAACLGLLSAACSDNDTDAQEVDVGGTTVLDLGTGVDSFWVDTDGVDPEVAGCHIEYNEATCDTVKTTARNFGELCQADGTLVESNPGMNVCHTHDNDIGHPYVVDCIAWCRNVVTLANGAHRGIPATTGECVVVHALPCDQGFVESAKCVCH